MPQIKVKQLVYVGIQVADVRCSGKNNVPNFAMVYCI